MMMDLLDDLVFGPLNLINRAEGWLKLLFYHDAGVRFAIPRQDKGGQHSLANVRELLARYGIASFGCTHDARCIYFLVKKRQAAWAEYLLLHAGVELRNPPVDSRNAHLVARHPPGWLPTPWSELEGEVVASPQRPSAQDKATQPPTFWQKLDRMLDEWSK
jgi:hypothetical protein